LAGLAFHVELFRNGETFEVNAVDLIALEALRFFERDLHKRLSQEKEVLTLEPRWFRKEKRNEDKKRVQDLFALVSEHRRDAVQKVMGEIFPPSAGNYSSDFESTWFQQLRVCSHQTFDRYFQLTTPEGDVSQGEIDGLIGSMSSKEELDAIFASLVQRDLLDVMLARLSSLKETLPLENAPTFLASLLDIEP
jgi:predicted KAP-like P-loop ATPase